MFSASPLSPLNDWNAMPTHSPSSLNAGPPELPEGRVAARGGAPSRQRCRSGGEERWAVPVCAQRPRRCEGWVGGLGWRALVDCGVDLDAEEVRRTVDVGRHLPDDGVHARVRGQNTFQATNWLSVRANASADWTAVNVWR